MRFEIQHITRYEYSRPVFLEPHVVRLRPRADANQSLEKFSIDVVPSPAGVSESSDIEDNCTAKLWFEGLHDRLEIAVSSQVVTHCTNPYNGLLDNGAGRLPLDFNSDQEGLIRTFLQPTANNDPLDIRSVSTLADEILIESDAATLTFLSILCDRLHKRVEKVCRDENGIQPIHETMRTCKGACRDLAMVFIAVCRHVGIPARFVSGYQEGDPDEPYWDLHAWAEVFLPGFGWRGFDPTHGLAVADRHVVAAASAFAENTVPVTGSFRGTGATSKLDHVIKIKTLQS